MLCNTSYMHQMQKVLGSGERGGEDKDKNLSAVWLSCSTHYLLFLFPDKKKLLSWPQAVKQDPTCKI